MTWEIDSKARTAETGGFAVKFSPMPAGSKLSADCFRDPERPIWRGKVVLVDAAKRDETLRLHMLHGAADAHGNCAPGDQSVPARCVSESMRVT